MQPNKQRVPILLYVGALRQLQKIDKHNIKQKVHDFIHYMIYEIFYQKRFHNSTTFIINLLHVIEFQIKVIQKGLYTISINRENVKDALPMNYNDIICRYVMKWCKIVFHVYFKKIKLPLLYYRIMKLLDPDYSDISELKIYLNNAKQRTSIQDSQLHEQWLSEDLKSTPTQCKLLCNWLIIQDNSRKNNYSDMMFKDMYDSFKYILHFYMNESKYIHISITDWMSIVILILFIILQITTFGIIPRKYILRRLKIFIKAAIIFASDEDIKACLLTCLAEIRYMLHKNNKYWKVDRNITNCISIYVSITNDKQRSKAKHILQRYNILHRLKYLTIQIDTYKACKHQLHTMENELNLKKKNQMPTYVQKYTTPAKLFLSQVQEHIIDNIQFNIMKNIIKFRQCAYDNCLKSNLKKYQKCKRCKSVFYCCRNHQKRDWNVNHRLVCVANKKRKCQQSNLRQYDFQ